MKKIIFLLFFILFLVASPVKEVMAESSIRVTPSILEEDLVEGGDIIKKEIRVINYSGTNIVMYAYLMDFKAADESGKAELITPNTEEGNYISSWIDITNEAIEFSSGEEKVISLIINVPEDVGPGGYYGAVVFGTEPPDTRAEGGEKGAAVSISQHTASLVLLQVAGDINEKAIVKEFNADRRFYSTPFDVNFKTRIRNLGNVHIKPRGIVEVRNMLGKKVAVITVNDNAGNILPDSERLFENVWKDDFGLGRYEASLAVSFGTPSHKGGQGRKTLAIKTYFWVFPMKIIIFIALALLAVVLFFFVFLKFYKKRAIKKAMQQFGVRKGYGEYSGKKYNSETGEFIKNFLMILLVIVVVVGLFYFLFF